MARNPGAIYSATYSNVPVYEFNVAGNHVMRRRADDWINATHILKVADYDKPARTRILEREVQKGVHEKVQGGYGKYQGTWIPLGDGRELAAKNGVLEKLGPIFDFVPGDRSPPPAPKHETAASRPRAQKPAATRKPAAGKLKKRKASDAPTLMREQARRKPTDYDRMDMSMRDMGTPDRDTVASESAFGDYDMSQFTGGSRKRQRVEDHMSQADKDHQLWADELLDYFMLQEDGESMSTAPEPPAGANLNRPIDERGHTALHWAAAMADVEVVNELIRRGASIDAQAKNGETPLMRSVLFTNSFDKRNMEKLAHLLIRTVNMQEWSGSTVFHHIANITHSKKKYDCARYYMDCVLNKMSEMLSHNEIERVLNEQDAAGDTAITIAARTGARKCVRSLLGRNAAVEIPNHAGETADQLIVQLNNRRAERSNNARQLSSSPFQEASQGIAGGAVQPPNGIPFDPLVPHSHLDKNQANGATVYKSEAALTLTSHVMPLVFSKAKALANTIEQELARKEEELREAEHVLELRRAELTQLSTFREQLRIKEAELAAGPSDEELAQQLRELEEECEGLTQEEHDFALNQLIGQYRGTADMDAAMYNGMDEEAMVENKERIVNELVIIRKKRTDLIKQIVQNLSVAGMSDKQNEYKRLITGALGVKEEDVESMLPEIVAELEDAQHMEQVGA